MNFRLTLAAAAIAAASLAASCAYAGETAAPAKKHPVTKKAKAKAEPSVEEQIKALREEMQSQINGLKSTLADKDAQLRQAQQTAADAQATAAKAQEAASQQQQAVTENASAVSSLQSTVDDMKQVNATIVSSVTDDLAKSAQKADLSEIAFGKFKVGATFFGDFSYWSDYDGSTQFIDNMTQPLSTADSNYTTFEVTRAYFNLLYTPSDAVSLRITPDIYRSTKINSSLNAQSENSLVFRLKYAFIDFNKLFAGTKYFKAGKVTFGQTQEPLVDWEEGLTGHRYTYKMPMDFAAGLSSTYVGARLRGPIQINGKTYFDGDLGVFTNGTYGATEASSGKQFMGRATYYPFGTKVERTGLGLTVFGDYGGTNVATSSTASGQYGIDRTVFMGHYQTSDKGYLIAGQYDISHNIKANGNTQSGYAFEGNARLGNAHSPFHAFGMYQYYEPYSNATNSDATRYSRTVGGIAYKFNKNFDIALTDSNLHYKNSTAAGKNDANAVSIFTQYSF